MPLDDPPHQCCMPTEDGWTLIFVTINAVVAKGVVCVLLWLIVCVIPLLILIFLPAEDGGALLVTINAVVARGVVASTIFHFKVYAAVD